MQRRQPPTGQNPPLGAPSERREGDALNEARAAPSPAVEPETSRLDPLRRRARQLPDFRTRDNIEQ